MGLFGSPKNKEYKEGLRLYEQGDYDAASRHLYEAAEAGHKEAQFLYAKMNEEQDFRLDAAKWYIISANAHHPQAAERLLGVLRSLGHVPVDYLKEYDVIPPLKKLAKQGNPDALFACADALHRKSERYDTYANITPDSRKFCKQQDKEQALKWALSAAQQGHTGAPMLCGRILEELGRPKEAKEWYRKAALANGPAQMDANACYRMAETQLQDGKYREAGKWFEKAWRAGDPSAAIEALHAYRKDSGKNSSKKVLQLCDAIIADPNLRANPRHSDDYATAIRVRAELTAQAGDEKSTLQQYEKASDGGDIIASKKCAEAYFYGRDGAKQDLSQALKYYQRVARDDCEKDAVYQCGKMYYFGDGCTKDYEKAFSYFEKLAARRDERGIFLTICMLYKGIGTPKDEARALELSEQTTPYWFDRQQKNWEAECQQHKETWNGLTLTTRNLESELYRLKKEQEEKGIPFRY